MTPPWESLVAHYRTLAVRVMAEMPMANAALQVEALGVTRLEAGWCGILLTPWFMNLVYQPDRALPGVTCTAILPSAEIALQPAQGVEGFWMAPLISPLQDFPHMDYARSVAQQILQQLLTPPAAPASALPQANPAGLTRQPLTRRGFFSALTLNS